MELALGTTGCWGTQTTIFVGHFGQGKSRKHTHMHTHSYTHIHTHIHTHTNTLMHTPTHTLLAKLT